MLKTRIKSCQNRVVRDGEADEECIGHLPVTLAAAEDLRERIGCGWGAVEIVVIGSREVAGEKPPSFQRGLRMGSDVRVSREADKSGNGEVGGGPPLVNERGPPATGGRMVLMIGGEHGKQQVDVVKEHDGLIHTLLCDCPADIFAPDHAASRGESDEIKAVVPRRMRHRGWGLDPLPQQFAHDFSQPLARAFCHGIHGLVDGIVQRKRRSHGDTVIR